MIQPDFKIVSPQFFGGKGGIFVVADTVTSIILHIFVQDCRRIKVDCFVLSRIFIFGKIKGEGNS